MALLLVLLLLLLGGCAVLRAPLPPLQVAPDPPEEPVRVETERFKISPGEDLIGRLYRIRIEEGDTLPLLARNFNLGIEEIRLANPGVDLWVPEVGQEILLPLRFVLPKADRRGIVVNTAAFRLFFFERPGEVWTTPVGVGREGWETPTGRTRIVEKRRDPAWHVPESIRREWARKGVFLPKVVPPGPQNPLGRFALRLGFRSYLIHGTNKPYGVGMRVSHGCIRLYPEAIEELFPRVGVGTEVQLVEQPSLLGWQDGMLYLQVYPPPSPAKGRRERLSLLRRLREIEKRFGVEVAWERVRRLLEEPRAIPFPILKGSPTPEEVLARAEPIPHPPLRFRYTPPPLTSGWFLRHPTPLPYRTALRFARMLHHMAPPFPARVVSEGEGHLLLVGPYPSRRAAREALARIGRDLPLRFQLVRLDFRESEPLF